MLDSEGPQDIVPFEAENPIARKGRIMIDVRYERISLGINEKKVLTPTMRMVEMALSNIGFKDGTWVLRSPHRTRKKGAERFRAIRTEGLGLRIRCKPAGNDTCYEWTLTPPEGVDRDLLFTDLCGLHPKDLRLVRSAPSVRGATAVLLGLKGLAGESSPPVLPSLFKSGPDEERPADGANKQTIDREAANAKEDLGESHERVAEAVGVGVHAVEKNLNPLDISSLGDGKLRSSEVLDKALIAIGSAMEGTFINSKDCSRAVVSGLKIDSLVAGGGSYDSVQGAMKSLMTNICNAGYFDRVSGERKTGKGLWTKGYNITDKGKSRLSELTGGPGEGVDTTDSEFEASLYEVGRPEPSGDDRIMKIKNLIDEREALKKQISDLEAMIEEFMREGEDDRLVLSGLRKAEEEKVAQREELEAEIARIRRKIAEMESRAGKAGRDMGELKAEMEALIKKKKYLEDRIFSPTGS